MYQTEIVDPINASVRIDEFIEDYGLECGGFGGGDEEVHAIVTSRRRLTEWKGMDLSLIPQLPNLGRRAAFAEKKLAELGQCFKGLTLQLTSLTNSCSEIPHLGYITLIAGYT